MDLTERINRLLDRLNPAKFEYEYEDWEDDEDDQIRRSFNITFITVYSLTFIFGMLGNGVVIWATGFKLKRTINTVWFLNLAVADFISIASLPLAITTTAMNYHWPFGRFMCKIYYNVDPLVEFASVYVLVVISVDRCVSVVWPVWAQNHRSVRKASYASLGVWALALVLSCPDFILADTRPSTYVENNTACDVFLSNFSAFSPDNNSEWSPSESPAVAQLRQFRQEVQHMPDFLLRYALPLIIILCCYVVIFHQLMRNPSLACRHLGRPFKITSAVITSFFLCFALYHISDIYDMPYDAFYVFNFSLTNLYRFLNPLLYVFMGQDFKKKACRSVLKVLESAFTEEEPRSNTSPNFSVSDKE